MSKPDKNCPICYETYGEQSDGSFLCKDGIDNSNFETPCKHYICVKCCLGLIKDKNEDDDEVKCPMCREDWTEWVFNRYGSDSDSDDE